MADKTDPQELAAALGKVLAVDGIDHAAIIRAMAWGDLDAALRREQSDASPNAAALIAEVRCLLRNADTGTPPLETNTQSRERSLIRVAHEYALARNGAHRDGNGNVVRLSASDIESVSKHLGDNLLARASELTVAGHVDTLNAR